MRISNNSKTRLPSNLRPTTCKCVHLVKLSHFRTRDKDCGHNIQSDRVENPTLDANFMALCFLELELSPIEVYIARIGIFYSL